MNPHFCFAPWTNLHLHPTGSHRICCVSPQSLGRSTAGDSLIKSYLGDKASLIRNTFLAGEKPASCWKCFDREERGGQSQRQLVNASFRDLSIESKNPADGQMVRHLDLSLSNFCNMSCRFCTPFVSSKWIQDAKRLPDDPDQFWGTYKSERAKRFDIAAEDLFEQVSFFPNLEVITIKGGEPFLSKEHPKFLELIIASGRADKIQLYYTTNGSVVPTEYFQLLARFKSVHVTASVDAVGELYKYIRVTAQSENRVEEALACFSKLSNCQLHLNFTLCALNVFAINDFLAWYDSLSSRLQVTVSIGQVVEPVHLDTYVLPLWFRKVASEQIEGHSAFANQMRGILSGEQRRGSLADFWRFVDGLDQLHGTSLDSVQPQFAELRAQGEVELVN